MANLNHSSPVALSYAQALLELANERQAATAIADELNGLKFAIEAQPLFGRFLADPAISQTEREAVFKRTFEGRVSPLMMNFLKVLNDKGRTGMLVPIAKAYNDLLDRQLGKIQVDVTVAAALNAAELDEVRQKVSKALNKHAILRQHVNESIIGGLVLRVEDQLLDGSVATQLKTMREQLLEAGPR